MIIIAVESAVYGMFYNGGVDYKHHVSFIFTIPGYYKGGIKHRTTQLLFSSFWFNYISL